MPKIVQDEDIYSAAMQTVIERGYARATTRQIAEAAGISEVTLFRKYGSKAELIKKAVESMGQRIDFDSAVRYTGDISADLLRVVEAYQGTAEKSGQFFFTVMLEIQRQPELAETIETPLTMINSLGKLLARYQSEGVLVQEHPVHAVAALIGPLIVVNMIRNTPVDVPLPPVDLVGHVQQFLDGRRPS